MCFLYKREKVIIFMGKISFWMVQVHHSLSLHLIKPDKNLYRLKVLEEKCSYLRLQES